MRGRIWVVIICGLLIMALTGAASSEVNFNVDNYTEDELISIVQMIYDSNSQLGYMYSSDILVVGQDIPAGIYEFWVEEEDIEFSQELKEKIDDYDYHCCFTTLCAIHWGDEYNKYSSDNYEEIFYDEYGIHKLITLKDGQSLWTKEYYGANYIGLRMKYVPDRKSGLFSN